MRNKIVFAMLAAALCFTGGRNVWATNYENKSERYALAEALERVEMTLAKGLTAAVSEGQPISGKFEMEDGKLQLSVYTMKGDKFSEVVVDNKSGKVAKAEPITGGEDLEAAKSQSQAMANAKISLSEAADKAVQANQGFAAISVTPSLKDGHPVANVSLTNDEGEDLKTVSENLD